MMRDAPKHFFSDKEEEIEIEIFTWCLKNTTLNY